MPISSPKSPLGNRAGAARRPAGHRSGGPRGVLKLSLLGHTTYFKDGNGAVIRLGAPAPMVKRLLTRIPYPPGQGARIGSALAAVRAISPPRRGGSGCLGHIRANPQYNPSFGTGGQGPAAGDNRVVLFPAAHDRGHSERCGVFYVNAVRRLMAPAGIDGGDEAVHKASRPKSSSQVTLCWRRES
jgi:hypothetical protein